MKKIIKITLVLSVVCVIAPSSIIYSKNVQASKLVGNFESAMKSSNYKEASAIRSKAEKDIIVEKLFGFNEKAGNIAQEQYESVKNDYLKDNITYEDFFIKINELEETNLFAMPEEDKNSLKSIETLRTKYRDSEGLVEQGKLKEALSLLNEIETGIDSNYKEKVKTLKQNISEEIKKDLESDINNLIGKVKYDEALSLLNSNKDLIPSEFYSEKSKQINDLIAKKKNEEEEKRKEAEEKEKKVQEEAKKRKEAKLAVYLKDYTPNPGKEAVVKNMSSKTDFLVWVDIPSQTTNIFVGSKGDWRLIKSYLCSTGAPGNETPKGTFTIKDRGKWFFSSKYQEGGMYWVRIYGNYLFHSLPMDQAKNVVDPTLGVAASHGCIRQSIENSAWFYNNIPAGTTVYIK